MTDVRAFGGSGFAIGRAGVDVAIIAGRFDGEVPGGRAGEFESLDGARIPVGGVAERNLSVADQHGDVVGPRGHGARNFRGFGGYFRKRNGVGGVSAEIDGSRVQDVLDIRAKLILALGAGRDRKQEERGKEEVSVRAFHMNVDARAGRDWPVLRECTSEGEGVNERKVQARPVA